MKRKITAKEYQNHCDDIWSIANDMKNEGRSPEDIEKFKSDSYYVLESQYEIVDERLILMDHTALFQKALSLAGYNLPPTAESVRECLLDYIDAGVFRVC